MARVYCRRNETNTLDFYVADKGCEYYLFSQKAYLGVEKHFRNGVSLSNAINHSKGRADYMIHKIMSKLPIYIKYVEKEYGIALLEQSKRRLANAA